MPSREKIVAAQRAKHARFIAKRLMKRLGDHDHETRMHSTNRLLPPGSLKRTTLRKIFGGWAKRLYGAGRILTKTLSGEVCFTLRQHFGLEIPAPMDEVVRLHNLMKQARKRKLEVRKSATAIGDNVDTLPYEARCSSLVAIKLQQNCFNGHPSIFAQQVYWAESSEPVQATGASEILAITAGCARTGPKHSNNTWMIDESFWGLVSTYVC